MSFRIGRIYKKACEELESMRTEGHEVEKLGNKVWRLNGIFIFPSSKKYRKVGSSVRKYENLRDLLKL